MLGVVERFRRRLVAVVDVLDDGRRRFDEAALHRLVAHDAAVVLDVRGGGDDVQHFARQAASLVRFLGDVGGGLDQAPQQGLVPHDPGVILDVRGGRHHVDQGAEVLHPPGAIEVAALPQLLAQRDRIDHVAALGEGRHRPVQQAVGLPVEHRVVEQLGGLEGRILVEQHGAEHGLLRLAAPGSLAAGVVALSRGGGGRYGRHPRLVASSWGFAARQQDDR